MRIATTRSMKPSGLGWAGDIPASWDVAKICLVARLESGHTPSRQHPEYWVPEECTIPWFSLADVWQLREGLREYLGETAEKISPKGIANSAARLLPAGTVVLSRTASVGFAGIMPKPMATTQDFANWVPGERVLSEFLLYALRAMRDEFQRATMGSTHQTIYMPDIRRLAIPVPPLDEQKRIVAFLRTRLAAVDALIATKERLLHLLGEKRQALIDHAVRRSGGTPTKLGYVVDLLAGNAFASDGFLRGSGVRLLRGVNVGVRHIRWDDTVGWDENDAAKYARFYLCPGDIVMGMDRPWISEGLRVARITAADVPSLLLQRVARLRAKGALLQDYLELLMLSTGFRDYFDPIMTGVSVPHISGDQILGFHACIPQRDAQLRAVSEFNILDESAKRSQKLLLQQLSTIYEYRQALMSTVVTGKLDLMREAA